MLVFLIVVAIVCSTLFVRDVDRYINLARCCAPDNPYLKEAQDKAFDMFVATIVFALLALMAAIV